MNFKRFHESKNLCPNYGWETGQYANGVWDTATPNRITSPFFAVEEGKQYTITINNGTKLSWINLNYFDSNKQWLGNRSTLGMAQFSTASQSETTPNMPTGSAYMRVTVRPYNEVGDITINDISTSDIAVNEGSQPLPYEPYSSEVWHDIPHYVHKTSTDTITTLPADIFPNDTTATVGLKGNMQQTGTPTPDNPIQPQGTGERMGNLFDKDARDTTKGYVLNEYLRNNGETTSSAGWRVSEYIEINEMALYTLDYNGSYNAPSICFYDNNKNFISGAAYSGRLIIPIETPEGAKYCRFSFRDTAKENIMFNEGSALLPYEPFGVKIPISSANTTTPVYLGEVHTTRKIKKLVLTGEENWEKSTTYQGSFYAAILDNAMLTRVLCTHAEYVSPISAQTYVYGKCGVDGGASTKNINLFIGESSWTTDDFKSYLQQQYAAGTPVCVWYVLATETTGIVNEPIRKIGDYADTVSGITIPTIAGANTLSVDTTLQPSEVTVNYKGWHPVADVHERENGAWT